MSKSITCNSLSEVRENIDRLDKIIVDHLAERTEYVLQAARFKGARSSVRDTSRIDSIVNRVRALAEEKGLDSNMIESIYRHLIEQSIAREVIYWDELNNSSSN